MHNRYYKTVLLAGLLAAASPVSPQDAGDRAYWLETMLKIVEPVYVNLSQNRLREKMPVETNGDANTQNRKQVSHLEALGRSFAGIAPWLNLGDDGSGEGMLREKYIRLCVQSIANAVDPASPDYMRFDGPGGQPLVDAAFFAHGLLRSKDRVWPQLDSVTQQRIVHQLKASRKIKPSESNWLLFAAMTETALLELTGECDMQPVHYAIQRHQEWYKGDGWYGDGANFHLDYYNSYVIQPMLLDILAVLREKGLDEDAFYDTALARFVRYADQLEKLISPEGTYPVLGRSMGYRFGAFQVLAQAALMEKLPEHVAPAQVRCALTAVIKRQTVPETFDAEGWLSLGFYGHQPAMADRYVSTGSAYLCTFVFLPLGLKPDNAFWTDAPQDWSSKKIWDGTTVPRDSAITN